MATGKSWMYCFVAAILSLVDTGTGEVAQPGPFSVIIYDRGKPIVFSPDTGGIRELVAHCEERLRTADGILRLAVTPHRISEMQQKEVAIEIHYSQPQTFVIPFNGQTLQPTRLLIPLTGDLAQGVSTIFHGSEAQYVAGPYRNSKGNKEIGTLVVHLGVQLD